MTTFSLTRSVEGGFPVVELDGYPLPHALAKQCVDFRTGVINLTKADEIAASNRFRILIGMIIDEPFLFSTCQMETRKKFELKHTSTVFMGATYTWLTKERQTKGK